MTHYCSYEEMSNGAGRREVNAGRNIWPSLTAACSVPTILEGNPWDVHNCRPPVPSPASVSPQLASRELARLLTRDRDFSGPAAARPLFLCRREALVPAATQARHFFLGLCPRRGIAACRHGLRALLRRAGHGRGGGTELGDRKSVV